MRKDTALCEAVDDEDMRGGLEYNSFQLITVTNLWDQLLPKLPCSEDIQQVPQYPVHMTNSLIIKSSVFFLFYHLDSLELQDCLVESMEKTLKDLGPGDNWWVPPPHVFHRPAAVYLHSGKHDAELLMMYWWSIYEKEVALYSPSWTDQKLMRSCKDKQVQKLLSASRDVLQDKDFEEFLSPSQVMDNTVLAHFIAKQYQETYHLEAVCIVPTFQSPSTIRCHFRDRAGAGTGTRVLHFVLPAAVRVAAALRNQ